VTQPAVAAVTRSYSAFDAAHHAACQYRDIAVSTAGRQSRLLIFACADRSNATMEESHDCHIDHRL
jgi:hypothetical protein